MKATNGLVRYSLQLLARLINESLMEFWPLLDYWEYLATFLVGGSLGWGWRYFTRMRLDYNPLPIISDGQSVTVCFVRSGKEVSNRAIISNEIRDILTRPKGGSAREFYRYSHIDEKGRFVYKEEL